MNLLPSSGQYKNIFSQLTEITYLACDAINYYGGFLGGIITPVFPYYKNNINEILERIKKYANQSNVIGFMGVLAYFYIIILVKMKEIY